MESPNGYALFTLADECRNYETIAQTNIPKLKDMLKNQLSTLIPLLNTSTSVVQSRVNFKLLQWIRWINGPADLTDKEFDELRE